MKNKWLGLFLVLLVAGCSEEGQVETYTNTNDDKLQSEVAQLFKDDDQIERANVLLVDNEIFVALQLKPFTKWKKAKMVSSFFHWVQMLILHIFQKLLNKI